jgi:adsorption protein B
LLLFAGFFFLLGALDDIAVDLHYLWFRLTGKLRTPTVDETAAQSQPLSGGAAIMIPAWREAAVIGTTLRHALGVWPQAQLRIYVGCYRNDPDSCRAVIDAARNDRRVRLVINDRDGPTSKADCLNRVYAALCEDERRSGVAFRMVLLHDAEDMVDPAALALLDKALDHAEFVQLPVLPEPQGDSRWIAGHYCDEFAEAHGKTLMVRQTLGAGIPAAGVGCAFSREMLGRIARSNSRPNAPFASDSLTEDYELGLRIAEMGGRTRVLRVRGRGGKLVATRAFFPGTLSEAVRQKARWLHGIAFQGWDRLGWQGSSAEHWMRLRDRRGPLTALVLVAAYATMVLATLFWLADLAGILHFPKPDPILRAIVMLNLASFIWRAAWRFAFTSREYGVFEGLRGIVRIPVANCIAILAGRRALGAYIRSLRGERPVWEKTEHLRHPAFAAGVKA